MKESKKIKRIMIAGTGSGSGKTTVTCGILKALVRKAYKVASFKCGPDYIDLMFHSKIIGTKSRNLDSFLCGENTTKYLFAKTGAEADFSIVEGVMGLYDGLGPKSTKYSSCDLSLITDTPTVLVVNAEGMYISVAAVVNGYLNFAPNNIKGIILNGTSEMMYKTYKDIIEDLCKVKVYGFLPRIPEAEIGSRHLGLVTAEEIEDLEARLNLLADAVDKYIDIDGLLKLGEEAPELEYEDIKVEKQGSCKIAVARDSAFCFYYEDGLKLLETMGAELKYFSPVKDGELPEDIDGLYLGGGYPELYAKELSENKAMLKAINSAVKGGLPTIAECGGFMYLQKSIKDKEGHEFEMVNVIDSTSMLTNKLSRFGYTTLRALNNNLLFNEGEQINAHEFHYSDSDLCGEDFLAVKPITGRQWHCIHGNSTMIAGYPHMHLWGNLKAAERFVKACTKFKNRHED